MTRITELNNSFAIEEQLVFEEVAGGLIVAVITNESAEALIALQGAQVLKWSPRMCGPVIWLSDEANYTRGKSVRGGVPVCWPWFGPHETNPALPSHGFARTNDWEVITSRVLNDGRTQLCLRLPENESIHELWPYAFGLEISITVGETLEIELHTENRQDEAINITEALHAYFIVGDITNVSVQGLEDTEYVDKVSGGQRKLQHGQVIIDSEIDRVYHGTRAECVIRDPGLKREIHISKRGSNSTIVWNPWQEKAKALGDMGENGYRRMLCVESGNALEDTICLAPGEAHTLWASYKVKLAV